MQRDRRAKVPKGQEPKRSNYKWAAEPKGQGTNGPKGQKAKGRRASSPEEAWTLVGASQTTSGFFTTESGADKAKERTAAAGVALQWRALSLPTDDADYDEKERK